MNYSAVIVAAGKGERSGLSYNKVLFPFQGRPVLCRSLDLFLQDPECREIIVVCSLTELEDFEARFAAPSVRFCIGGKTRCDSVLAGVRLAGQPYVLIHDGARPFAAPQLVSRLKKGLESHPAVIPGIEVTDTIKEIDENGYVVHTPVRSKLRAVQTPQAFVTSLLLSALEKAAAAGSQVSDDAMAVELFEQTAALCVPGDPANWKITHPEDLKDLEKQSISSECSK